MATYKAFRIHNDDGHRTGIEELPLTEPDAGEVLIRVAYSSVNYKDALAGTGKGKILAKFPLVGGIDASGIVAASADGRFGPGDPVLATGYGLSCDHDGGYAEYLKVPGGWVVPMPAGMDPRNAMILGTAGFTAALAIHRMLVNGQRPDMGPVLVTGASGGVGSIAVDILKHLGFEPAAVSGKQELRGWLQGLGAARVIGRNDLPGKKRPLETAVWGGALDNVGGEMLAQITRTVRPWGNIASIGLAGGHELATTVMPFILRGASLLGIASANAPHDLRNRLWALLATDWRPPHLESLLTATVGLDGLADVFDDMLAGKTHGRVLVERVRLSRRSMPRIGRSLTAASGWIGGWLVRYVGWLLIVSFVTLGGAMVLMLFKDWTLKSLFTSMMAWPILGMAMLVAAPMSLLRVGRIYLFSAVAGGLLYNLILLIA